MSGRLMSEKYPRAEGTYDAAMSFEEIGKRLGIPKQTAYFHFVSALKKLRRDPHMRALFRLALERQTLASRRCEPVPDADEDGTA